MCIACLKVALSHLPDKDALFALGVDRPLYFSVHSAHAELAPEGGALIHVAKFLGISIEPKPKEDQQKLEEFLDLLQPEWRDVLVKTRPLPNLVVSNALVTAAGGLAGRPGIKIGRLHRQEEKIIEESGITYTFLRSSAFMQNFVIV